MTIRDHIFDKNKVPDMTPERLFRFARVFKSATQEGE